MSCSSSKSKKMIQLKSSDGIIFEIKESAAVLSQTIKIMIDEEIDCRTDTATPLVNVNAKTLAKVIEYCNKHAAEEESSDKSVAGASSDKETVDYNKEKEKKEEDLKAFDKEFVDVDNMSEMFDLLSAANYLEIKKLLDLIAQSLADCIKNNTVEKIREIFGIVNDFTPEEEKAVRDENSWAFN